MAARKKQKCEKLHSELVFTLYCQKNGVVYDVTDKDDEMKTIMNLMVKAGQIKAFAVQHETGDQGLEHWQGCLKTWSNKRIRLSAVMANTQYGGSKLWQAVKQAGTIGPCVNWNASYAYCNKEESRTAGHEPLNEVNCKPPRKATDMELMGKHLIESNPYGWQEDTLALTEQWVGQRGSGWANILARNGIKAWTREIQILVDPTGNSGKTMFCSYIARKYGYDNVLMVKMKKEGDQMAKDVVSSLLGVGGQQHGDVLLDPGPWLVCVDVPRGKTGTGVGKRVASEMMAGIECIKDGKVQDGRYGARTAVWRTAPIVLVFCNAWPHVLRSADCLSQDRVNVKWVWKDKTLHHEEEPVPVDVNDDEHAGGDQVDPYPGGVQAGD